MKELGKGRGCHGTVPALIAEQILFPTDVQFLHLLFFCLFVFVFYSPSFPMMSILLLLSTHHFINFLLQSKEYSWLTGSYQATGPPGLREDMIWHFMWSVGPLVPPRNPAYLFGICNCFGPSLQSESCWSLSHPTRVRMAHCHAPIPGNNSWCMFLLMDGGHRWTREMMKHISAGLGPLQVFHASLTSQWPKGALGRD